MTGVLPIKKYSSGSALNMFDEHTFLKDRQFGEFFGFTEKEVINLVDKNSEIKFEDLESWYNGYLTAKGIKIYNPRSVVKALQNDYCESYWTNTGEPRTKEEIYSAMIVLGFLSYYDGYLKIPNKELMKEFEKALRDMLIFTFHPRRRNDTAFIVELKKDEDVDVAINQIKSKEYIETFKKENKNKKVLAVAICYNSKEKEHKCKIEEI